jgi:hypothetical protein
MEKPGNLGVVAMIQKSAKMKSYTILLIIIVKKKKKKKNKKKRKKKALQISFYVILI